MSNVSDFLIERLENLGVRHVFGIPGDYVLDFYSELWENDNIEVINTTDENHAGFAADAYARMNGVGCACVTYSVGALKVTNAVACAYAERSPLIIISGSPGIKERDNDMLLHHIVGSFNCQKEIFEKITCASVVLDNPVRAGYEIDRVFEALNYYKQPVYIELPRDVAKKSISYDVYKLGTPQSPETDIENLNEALEEVSEWVKSAKKPVILAGVEVARYGLGEKLIKFAEKNNIPVATTLLSKSVINECHPLFSGIYMGISSSEKTRKLIEKSDCLLMFGVMLTDMTLCFMPSSFKKRRVISCSVESLKVKNHTFTDIRFKDFCEKLFKLELIKSPKIKFVKNEKKVSFRPKDAKITVKRLFDKINSILDKDMAIVADIGDSLFGSSELIVHHRNHFLSPAFYTSMGSAIPGALGVQTAMPDVRPIVILGDGAFQMAATELGTIASRGLNPIIFILNNKGYTTERHLKDGGFNDIFEWNYHIVPEVFGRGKGFLVNTEMELEEAVDHAIESKEFSIVNVVLDKADVTPALLRMTESLSKRL